MISDNVLHNHSSSFLALPLLLLLLFSSFLPFFLFDEDSSSLPNSPTSSDPLSSSSSQSSSPASKSSSQLSSQSAASTILVCSCCSMMTFTSLALKYSTKASSSPRSTPKNSTTFFSSLRESLMSNCLLEALMRWNSTAWISSMRKQRIGFGMKIRDCLSMYSQPACAFTFALTQGCPALDLKWLPGWMRLSPAVAWMSSTKTWNCAPEYSGFNSLRLGLLSCAQGLTLVLMSTSISFLIWMTMQRQTVWPWQMGLSLLSCSTMETCDSLVMGRMKPLVMFLYQMVQLKVMPWNLMFFWQKSMVYLPLGTERLTSRRVASDSPANSPILARSTICLQIFSAALSFSFSSPSTSISPPSSLSSLGSSTWKRISHIQSSFPTQSEAVQTMISFLLMVELLMAVQLMLRIWWFPDMERRERLEVSYPMRPQFMPLNDIKRQISIKYNTEGLNYKGSRSVQRWDCSDVQK